VPWCALFGRRRARSWTIATITRSSREAHFWDSQISAEVIHHWDGAFAVPSGWIASGLLVLSGPPEGAPRQHCDGGLWLVGFRPVFHAKRLVSGVPARPGERSCALELPDSVRDRENPLRPRNCSKPRKSNDRSNEASRPTTFRIAGRVSATLTKMLIAPVADWGARHGRLSLPFSRSVRRWKRIIANRSVNSISDRTGKAKRHATPKLIVRQARQRIARIRAALNGIDYLCSGTLRERMKICGKPGCRCAQDPQARHGPYYEWGHVKAGKLVHRTGLAQAGNSPARRHRQLSESQKTHANMGGRDRAPYRCRSHPRLTQNAEKIVRIFKPRHAESRP
jgi:hypothetical protein